MNRLADIQLKNILQDRGHYVEYVSSDRKSTLVLQYCAQKVYGKVLMWILLDMDTRKIFLSDKSPDDLVEVGLGDFPTSLQDVFEMVLNDQIFRKTTARRHLSFGEQFSNDEVADTLPYVTDDFYGYNDRPWSMTKTSIAWAIDVISISSDEDSLCVSLSELSDDVFLSDSDEEETGTGSANILDLSTEVVLNIVSHLDINDAMRLSQTSKHMQSQINQPAFWRDVLNRDHKCRANVDNVKQSRKVDTLKDTYKTLRDFADFLCIKSYCGNII